MARGLPITGWVRNEADGSVTLEAQGPQGDVHTLLERIRASMGRFITAEDARDLPEVATETTFLIAR